MNKYLVLRVCNNNNSDETLPLSLPLSLSLCVHRGPRSGGRAASYEESGGTLALSFFHTG